jgi:hypothetical protein
MVCPSFWEDYYMLIYTHCWEVMNSVGSHGSLLLLFVMKVMVCHFVSDSHKVMTALIVVLPATSSSFDWCFSLWDNVLWQISSSSSSLLLWGIESLLLYFVDVAIWSMTLSQSFITPSKKKSSGMGFLSE